MKTKNQLNEYQLDVPNVVNHPESKSPQTRTPVVLLNASTDARSPKLRTLTVF